MDRGAGILPAANDGITCRADGAATPPRVDFTLPNGDEGFYVFEIKAMTGFQFKVVREQCVAGSSSFDREGNEVKLTLPGITPRRQ
jgi:hypothetical protein